MPAVYDAPSGRATTRRKPKRPPRPVPPRPPSPDQADRQRSPAQKAKDRRTVNRNIEHAKAKARVTPDQADRLRSDAQKARDKAAVAKTVADSRMKALSKRGRGSGSRAVGTLTDVLKGTVAGNAMGLTESGRKTAKRGARATGRGALKVLEGGVQAHAMQGYTTGAGPTVWTLKGKKGGGLTFGAQTPLMPRSVKIDRSTFGGRFALDLANLGPSAASSVYLPGAAAVEAVQGRPQRAKQMLKDFDKGDPSWNAAVAIVEKAKGNDRKAGKRWKAAKKAANEHPGVLAVQIAGAKGVIGRGAGTGTRLAGRAGSKTAQRVGTTKRAPKTLPDTNLVEPRKYSKDLINKGVQVAIEKRATKRSDELRRKAAAEPDERKRKTIEAEARRADPRIINDKEIQRRVDEQHAAAEDVRRINQAEVLSTEQKALKGAKKAGPIVSLLSQRITKPTLKSLRQYRDDLNHVAKELEANGQKAKLSANRKLVNDLDKAISRVESGKLDFDQVRDISERYVERNIGSQRDLVEAGLHAADESERRSVLPFAVKELGAHRDLPYLKEREAAARKPAKKATKQAKKARGRVAGLTAQNKREQKRIEERLAAQPLRSPEMLEALRKVEAAGTKKRETRIKGAQTRANKAIAEAAAASAAHAEAKALRRTDPFLIEHEVTREVPIKEPKPKPEPKQPKPKAKPKAKRKPPKPKPAPPVPVKGGKRLLQELEAVAGDELGGKTKAGPEASVIYKHPRAKAGRPATVLADEGAYVQIRTNDGTTISVPRKHLTPTSESESGLLDAIRGGELTPDQAGQLRAYLAAETQPGGILSASARKEAGDHPSTAAAIERQARELLASLPEPKPQVKPKAKRKPKAKPKPAPKPKPKPAPRTQKVTTREKREISTKEILEALASKEHGERIGGAVVSQRPPQRIGGSDWYSSGAREPAGESRRFGGKATLEGTAEHSNEQLIRQQIRSRTLIDALDNYTDFINEIALRKPNGKHDTYKNRGDAVQAADNRSAKGDVQWTVARLNPRHSDAEMAEMAEGTAPDGSLAQMLKDGLEGRGDGPYVIIPEAAAKRLQTHMDSLGATSFERGARTMSSGFRKVVLGLSLPWMVGNIAEAGVRTTVNKAGPMSYRRGKAYLEALDKLDPEAAKRHRARTIGGGHYAYADRGIFNNLDAFDEGTVKELTRIGQKLRSVRGVKAVPELWDRYTHFVFNRLNKGIEQKFQTALLGRALKDLYSPDAQRLSTDAVRQIVEKGEVDANTASALGREIDRMYGKYSKFSPDKRIMLQRYAPFWQWQANAARFLAGMPNNHPMTTLALASLQAPTEDYRREHGLEVGTKGALPPFLRGSIPVGKGHLRASRFTPFGLANDPLGTFAGQFIPQVSSALKALGGLDWNNRPLKVDGEDANDAERVLAAFYAMAGSSVPGFSLGERTAVKGPESILKSAIGYVPPSKKKVKTSSSGSYKPKSSGGSFKGSFGGGSSSGGSYSSSFK